LAGLAGFKIGLDVAENRVRLRKVRIRINQGKNAVLLEEALVLFLDWSPFLRQTVRTHFSSNGELSHGIVTQAVHTGV
jgi:hypothetical protein